MVNSPGRDWTPPEEIVLLDEESLALVDEFIRSLASNSSSKTEGIRAFDPYHEANLGWLRAAHEQAKGAEPS